MISIHTQKIYGYTLIEMLVVVAIILIVVPTLFASIQSLYNSHASTLSESLALIETTNAVGAIVRDVRSAVYSEDGALPVAEISTSTLTLYTDTDFDGRVERVRYFLNNKTIFKGIIEPTLASDYPLASETISTLITNVVNENTNTPLFRYYTSTSSEITTLTNTLGVRRVEVTVTGSSYFRSKTSEISLRSSASIRNLKETY